MRSKLIVTKIDSIVEAVDGKECFYRADSVVNIYNKDSNLVAISNLECFYNDKNGKDLFKVDQLDFIVDTSSTIYYYSHRQLIKIDYHSAHKGKTLQIELYYDRGKLISEEKRGDLVAQIFYFSLFDRSKEYLKHKPRLISPNSRN